MFSALSVCRSDSEGPIVYLQSAVTCLLACLLVCVCACLLVLACMYIYTPAREDHLGVLSQVSSTRSLTGLILSKKPRVAGQRAPGSISLALALQAYATVPSLFT